jgi:hypothetical protein
MFFSFALFFLLFSSFFVLNGCQKNTVPDKKNDLDFTVVAGTDIPDELQKLIDDRSSEEFELTYSDGSFLYVVKGYGEQKTTGYNITVTDFYQGEDCIVFDTELFGPKKDEEVSNVSTYPYIVIKTEYIEESVVFPR